MPICDDQPSCGFKLGALNLIMVLKVRLFLEEAGQAEGFAMFRNVF